jgi:hypothetical protein
MQCCLVSGPSHTPPSVIVAKIMEKLREHERENIPPPSVVSAPVIGNSGTTSPSLSVASNKFSRAARRVLTRTSVLGALPFIARYQIFHTIDFLNHNFHQIMKSMVSWERAGIAQAVKLQATVWIVGGGGVSISGRGKIFLFSIVSRLAPPSLPPSLLSNGYRG